MQFQEHIDCYMPGVTGFEYATYGCYCGTFNQGRPIDSVDSCCYLHDLCYGQTDKQFNVTGTNSININVAHLITVYVLVTMEKILYNLLINNNNYN